MLVFVWVYFSALAHTYLWYILRYKSTKLLFEILSMARQALRKQRLACDRCNSLKLKCPRIGDSESCSRCIRASAACTFSPSMRGLKPQARERELRRLELDNANEEPTQPTERPSLPDDSADIQNDAVDSSQWEFGMLGMVPGDATDLFLNPGQEDPSPAQRPDPANNFLDYQPTVDMALDSDWTGGQNFGMADALPDNVQQQLLNIIPTSHGQPETGNKSANKLFAELYIQLEAQAVAIPPLSIYKTQGGYSEAALAAINAEWQSGRMRVFSIQQIFESSQALVNTYPKFCEEHLGSSFQSRGSLEVKSPENSSPSAAPSSGPHDSDTRALHTKDGRFDHASVFLLLSCYHRAADVWTSLFSHVEYGAMMGRFSHGYVGQAHQCQRLRIGSFVPATKVPLEIVLGVEFQKQLVDQIRDFEKRVKSIVSSIEDRGGQTGSLKPICEMIEDLATRATKLLSESIRIQTLVENSNSSDADSASST